MRLLLCFLLSCTVGKVPFDTAHYVNPPDVVEFCLDWAERWCEDVVFTCAEDGAGFLDACQAAMGASCIDTIDYVESSFDAAVLACPLGPTERYLETWTCDGLYTRTGDAYAFHEGMETLCPCAATGLTTYDYSAHEYVCVASR